MQIDTLANNFFQNIRIEEIYFIILVITYSGSVIITLTVTLLSLLSFYIHKEKGELLRLIISVLGTSASVTLIKYLIERPRPEGSLYTEFGPAFPSFHAAIAISLYGFLFWHARGQKNMRHRKLLMTMLAMLIILIGVSRLYLGVHYLSDVLAGYAIGFMWLLISLGISKSKI